MRKKLPKKVLHIKELTFIVPDDFDGNTLDAIQELVNYSKNNESNKLLVDRYNLYSSLEMLIASKDKTRVCGSYGIFELENNHYTLKDGKSP